MVISYIPTHIKQGTHTDSEEASDSESEDGGDSEMMTNLSASTDRTESQTTCSKSSTSTTACHRRTKSGHYLVASPSMKVLMRYAC